MLATLALCSLAHAGSGGKGPISYGKAPVLAPLPVDAGCACFAPGSTVSLFGAAIFPTGDQYDDALGGGIAYEQFFTENIGISAAAAWYATESEVHNYSLDAVVRLPLGDLCIAPYAVAGIGVHSNSHTEVIGRFGAGLDLRLSSMDCKGIFADWIYTTDSGAVEDYSTVRLGIKLPF